MLYSPGSLPHIAQKKKKKMALSQLMHPCSASLNFHLQFKHPKPNHFITRSPILKIFFNSSARTASASRSSLLHSPIQSLDSIRPFVLSQWQPILKGWLCSAISVYSLSRIVPGVGRFSALASAVGSVRLSEEGLALGGWFLVRTAANYLQQAFLWDAALDSVYKIRVHVFERVLQRDLGFFEGRNVVSAGDIAYRITAEASDVADTVYALLNTMVPSTLQLSAMAGQMLMISPALSFISTLVIPSIALIVAYLGKKLRQISKNAHLSIATLSSYLNEVLPSIFFVKANKSELSEGVRFQRLAHADRTQHLKKKKMKALIPQITQIIYFGALCIFCFGAMAFSRGFLDYSGVVSFVTSLVLLIEPIQPLIEELS